MVTCSKQAASVLRPPDKNQALIFVMKMPVSGRGGPTTRATATGTPPLAGILHEVIRANGRLGTAQNTTLMLDASH